jgi:hypothetical protein
MAPAEPHFAAQSLRVVAGLAIWGAHLAAVYAWTALACARHFAAATIAGVGLVPLVIGALTVLALGGAAVMLVVALRRRQRGGDADRFADNLTVLGCVVALIAIVWSGLPAIIVARPCG